MKDMAAADQAISAFHTALNDGRYDAIYSEASPDLRRATSSENMSQLLTAVRRKLGAFQSGKSAGWNDNVATSGHFITMNYSAIYQHGTATERFVYRLDGPAPQLVGYNINSNALILN